MFLSTRHVFNTIFARLTDRDRGPYTETVAADRNKKTLISLSIELSFLSNCREKLLPTTT